jgi:CHAT domain-containing protein
LRIVELLWPDAEHALPHIRAASDLVERAGLPVLRQQTQQQLGHAHLLLAHFAEAERVLLDAIAEIEQSRSTLVQERMRAAFLGDKLAAYEDLISLYLQRQHPGDPVRAFNMAERAKSRALADVLSGHIQPMQLTHAAAEIDVQTRLRALQSELDAAYTALLRNEGESEKDQESTQERALALERELSRLQLQLPVSKATDNHSGWHELDILAHLPEDAVVISYMMCDDDIVAFVVVQRHVMDARIVTQITQIHPLLEKLQAQWNRFREGTAFTQRHMPLLIQSAQNVLRELHAVLLKPISHLFEQALNKLHSNKLVIVPHGLLHHVPFHALFNGDTDHYVIDDYEVSYIPSATLWGLCQQRPAPQAGRAAVFGVSDVLIPAAEAEAQAVAQQLPGASLCLNQAATLAEFQSRAPGCAIVHLACHGFFRADNPLFSALKLHDGWLMAADVPLLDLSGALVTLSACESGRSQVLAGDELVGLSRAFLGAGAATLVTSLWLVHDETTAPLMQNFYAHLTNHAARATALRQAQLALKASHPHPYFWAVFVLVGQR